MRSGGRGSVDCWVFFGQCLFVFQAAFIKYRQLTSYRDLVRAVQTWQVEAELAGVEPLPGDLLEHRRFGVIMGRANVLDAAHPHPRNPHNPSNNQPPATQPPHNEPSQELRGHSYMRHRRHFAGTLT